LKNNSKKDKKRQSYYIKVIQRLENEIRGRIMTIN
jgi:hypothetical protein